MHNMTKIPLHTIFEKTLGIGAMTSKAEVEALLGKLGKMPPSDDIIKDLAIMAAKGEKL